MHSAGRSLLLALLWSFANGIYHLPSAQEFKAPPGLKNDSLFGYSITFQSATKRLIISAPNNDMVGQVFECNFQSKECLKIENTVPKDYAFGKMWLGATVASGPNFTMACAPRYIERKSKIGTFGKCFATSPSTRNMTAMHSLTDLDKGTTFREYEQYMDTLGWSIDVAKNGSILVGGPAMWRGRAVMYSDVDAQPKLVDWTDDEIKFNYGYSVTSGHFFSGNDSEIMQAISSPYGKMGLGAVAVSDGKTSWFLPKPMGPRSPPVGALFGAALASASLRPPGQRQALLVGAPAYAEKLKGQVDVGAVYIYQYDLERRNITHQKTILGKVNGGRFGSSIISVGDLNGDKRDEIAISAPYEGSGVVYIYSGAVLLSDVSDSMMKWLQRIPGSGVFGLSLASFGSQHGIACNELAIGAPESNKVVVLQCIPKIIVNVNHLQENKTAVDRRAKLHFDYRACIDIIYPDNVKNIVAEIEVSLSITHATARLEIGEKIESGSVTFITNIEKKLPSYCHEVGIFIPELQEGADPVVQYHIAARQLNSPESQNSLNSSHVLVSDLSVTTLTGEVWVANCAGADGECQPKLTVEIVSTIPTNYTIGSSPSESFRVSSSNAGDVAYSACAYVLVAGARLLRFPPACTRAPDANALDCRPKRPIYSNTTWNSDPIELDMKSLNSDSKVIEFKVVMFPRCLDKVVGVTAYLTAKVQPDSTGITLKGSTNLGDTIKLSHEELEESGKYINHVYSVLNYGFTDWVNIQCDITLETKPFFEGYNLTIDSRASYQCTNPQAKDGQYRRTCVVSELKKNQKFDVMVPIYVTPGVIEPKNLKHDNVTVTSNLELIFGANHLQRRVTSTLKVQEATVPLWIIIIAALVGLLIIIIVIFTLYECGFLRRKNKAKLKRLRKSVYRQSVRRSQMRQSMRSTERHSGDKEKLVEGSSEENRHTDTPPTGNSPVDKEPGEKTFVGEELVKKDTQTDEKDVCTIKKNEQIIKGLQKNMNVKSHLLAHSPKPKVKADASVTETE